MKKIILSLCFLSGALFGHPEHSPELTAPLNTLCQFEETRNILNAVEAQGRLILKAAYFGSQASNAAWYPDERTICINFSNQRTEGSVIRSLVFELNNALNQSQFDYLDQLAMQGRVSKEKYIESVEQLEYSSACKTMDILKRGIQKGVFPADAAHWPVAPNFAEHYRVQMEAGHSHAIGALYDQLRQSQHFAQR